MSKTNDKDRSVRIKASEENTGAIAGARAWSKRGWAFLREVRQESTKVTWPNRKETLGSTGIIIVVVILVGVYLGLVDYVLTVVVQHVLG